MGSVVVGSHLYYISGRNGNSTGSMVYDDLLDFDSSSQTWRARVGGTGIRRYNPVVVPMGKQGFVLWGGVSGDGSSSSSSSSEMGLLDDVSSFDVVKGLWAADIDQGRTSPAMMNSRPPPRAAQAVGWDTTTGVVLEFGGMRSSSSSSSSMVYTDELYVYKVIDGVGVVWTGETY